MIRRATKSNDFGLGRAEILLSLALVESAAVASMGKLPVNDIVFEITGTRIAPILRNISCRGRPSAHISPMVLIEGNRTGENRAKNHPKSPDLNEKVFDPANDKLNSNL